MATLYIKNDELRRTAFALRAFNVELAQVRDLTKSDQLAKIRFQFWLDIIDDIYKNKADNTALLSMLSNFNNFPVAYELNEVSFSVFVLNFFELKTMSQCRFYPAATYQNIGSRNW